MWHSMGTMKLFGYTALDKSEGSKAELAYAMKMHENYDYVISGSKAMNKYKINKTTDQVSMLVANLRTIFSSQGNYAGLNNASARAS